MTPKYPSDIHSITFYKILLKKDIELLLQYDLIIDKKNIQLYHDLTLNFDNSISRKLNLVNKALIFSSEIKLTILKESTMLYSIFVEIIINDTEKIVNPTTVDNYLNQATEWFKNNIPQKNSNLTDNSYLQTTINMVIEDVLLSRTEDEFSLFINDIKRLNSHNNLNNDLLSDNLYIELHHQLYSIYTINSIVHDNLLHSDIIKPITYIFHHRINNPISSFSIIKPDTEISHLNNYLYGIITNLLHYNMKLNKIETDIIDYISNKKTKEAALVYTNSLLIFNIIDQLLIINNNLNDRYLDSIFNFLLFRQNILSNTYSQHIDRIHTLSKKTLKNKSLVFKSIKLMYDNLIASANYESIHESRVVQVVLLSFSIFQVGISFSDIANEFKLSIIIFSVILSLLLIVSYPYIRKYIWNKIS